MRSDDLDHGAYREISCGYPVFLSQVLEKDMEKKQRNGILMDIESPFFSRKWKMGSCPISIYSGKWEMESPAKKNGKSE